VQVSGTNSERHSSAPLTPELLQIQLI